MMNSAYSDINEITSKLNPHFLKRVQETKNVKVYRISATELLFHPSRFDILIKYLYVSYRERGINIPFIKEMYSLHIRRQDGCYFEKDGNKHSLADYFDSFHALIDSIRDTGFDPENTIIPINSSGQILDGSHRVAACAFFDKDVTVAEFTYSHDLSYKYFSNILNLPSEYLDFVALNYCRLNNKSYILNLRPIAEGLDATVEEIISRYAKIYYKKYIDLSYDGIFFVEHLFYKTEKWIGTFEDDFSGARKRAEKLNANNNVMRIYLIECESLETVKTIKKLIREVYKIGNDSLHITDTREETIDLANLFFNSNSLHLANNLKKYPNRNFMTLLNTFKLNLKNANISNDDIIIDGSSTMALYGLRITNDIDYLFSDHCFDKLSNLFENNDSRLKYHLLSKDELIYDPRNFLYFENIKFISLESLRTMKGIRKEFPKDIKDIKLINSLLQKRFSFFPNYKVLVRRFRNLPTHLMPWIYKTIDFVAPATTIRRKILSYILFVIKNFKFYLFCPKLFLNYLLLGTTRSIHYCGYKVFFHRDSRHLKRLFLEDNYMSDILYCIFSILDSKKSSPIMIDVGSDFGLIGLAVAKRYGNCRIFCFEPNQIKSELFFKTININQLTNKIFIDSVKANDLDTWFEKISISNPDLIRISVGRDLLNVLQGGICFLSKIRPPLLVDFNKKDFSDSSSTIPEILSFLEKCGYEILNLDGNALGGNQKEQLRNGNFTGNLLAMARVPYRDN